MEATQKRHVKDKGVICERCKSHVFKGNYKRINVLEPIEPDTTGRCTTIHRMSLCNHCYDEYIEMISAFCNSDTASSPAITG